VDLSSLPQFANVGQIQSKSWKNGSFNVRPIRLAVAVSHPIQHFAPWHREIAKIEDVDLRVFFFCDWGVASYLDPEFGVPICWDIPLLEGYPSEFLPTARRPRHLSFWQLDNPSVEKALERFSPDVVQVFGYAHRTNWRISSWASRQRKPLLLFSDSNVRAAKPVWKRLLKAVAVRNFYSRVDGALYVGDNNRAYHRHYGLPDERLFPGAYPIGRSDLLAAVPDRERTRRRLRQELRIPADAFVVMFCGKYSSRKSPLDLVAAAHTAFQSGIPVWALLVGEGSERSAIEEYCRRKSVRNTVLTGFINQSSLPEYYVAADALAVTSSYDPHPLVVTEGACLGLPAIVSDRVGCIGANDTARPGVTALVYPWGNRERLKDAIVSLYQDRALYERMFAAVLQISETQDAPVVAQQLVNAVGALHSMGPRSRGAA
jgi:glycosyltransferase involved in cell wall biosynthesis